MIDYLDSAKEALKTGADYMEHDGYNGANAAANIAIACALIALVERIDKLTDDGALKVKN